MKHSLLFEIGCEEIPARFLRASAKQFTEKVTKWFQEQRITIGTIQSFATPRRLAVYVTEVEESQTDQTELLRGPAAHIAKAADGSWSKAAAGFARKNGVHLESLELREEKGTAYVYAVKHQKGELTEQVLKASFVQVLESLTFPKTMRWESTRTKFIRPVRWLMCLLGEKVVPISWVNITANRFTRGHRFLGEEIAISHADDYQTDLRNQFVIVDMNERQQQILSQLEELQKEHNWQIPVDPELLEEVTQLVEYPTVLSGRFESDFLQLPKEVLITTMREHQRYFPVENEVGELLPHFITIRNGDKRSLQVVSQGNEKVLRARLKDAQFFFLEDKKQSIDKAMDKLKQIVYQEELGSMFDRVERSKKLAFVIGEQIGLSEAEQATLQRAATIAKFDQATQMVNEFPELEGYMGKEYALLHGEPTEVAQALYEQVLPRHPEDELPKSKIGTILSLADRLDSLASGFGIGLPSSGSQDPYGFRKKAAAVVQLLLQNRSLSLSLSQLIPASIKVVDTTGKCKRPKEQVQSDLFDFFRLRLKSYFMEQGIRYDVIDAILSGEIGDLTFVSEKAAVLMDIIHLDSFKLEVEGFTRAANLAAKANEQAIDPALFQSKEEKALFDAFLLAKESYTQKHNSVADKYRALASMAPTIHIFFDHVMVMVEDEHIKKNRLALLREIHKLASSFASFELLVFGGKD